MSLESSGHVATIVPHSWHYLVSATYISISTRQVPLELMEVGLGLIRAKNGITLKVEKRL